jgi:hypothetical protein
MGGEDRSDAAADPDGQEDDVGLHPLAVRFHSRTVTAALTVAAVAVAASLGVSAAGAEQDGAPPAATGTEEPPPADEPDTPAEPAEAAPAGGEALSLLQRLDELEDLLPAAAPPDDVELDLETTWGEFAGDAGGAHALLGTAEGELRRLFVDADDADGPVADAVADVVRGWLDLWQGTAALAVWEGNDLAFPIDTTDDDAVATGSDELRGQAEKGLELLLQGRARHLVGYGHLRELGQAEAAAQARLDARAADAEAFDAELRPLVERMLSQRTTNVVKPVERFDSRAPGVEARARTLEVTCVDREALEADEVADVAEASLPEPGATTRERVDCPDLPETADTP